MADGARERREAIRQLADLRRRLASAEDALTGALAVMKSAEGAFDAASDRFDAAELPLEEAREQRAQARQDRYAARQAYERPSATATADRLARRVHDLADVNSGALGPPSATAQTPRGFIPTGPSGDTSWSPARSWGADRCGSTRRTSHALQA